jgi:hypothetical protein
MLLNNSREKHFRRARRSHAAQWADYDAQPAEARHFYQNFPINIWPNNTTPRNEADFARNHARYLAGLRDVWGPDHPAVIDAARKVATRRGEVVTLATADDL